jgi:hypothetical protein
LTKRTDLRVIRKVFIGRFFLICQRSGTALPSWCRRFPDGSPSCIDEGTAHRPNGQLICR